MLIEGRTELIRDHDLLRRLSASVVSAEHTRDQDDEGECSGDEVHVYAKHRS